MIDKCITALYDLSLYESLVVERLINDQIFGKGNCSILENVQQ